MAESRNGIGYDAHRFGGVGPVILCGVAIEHEVGVVGTSDADVAVHALCDALLGAAALGDLGTYFPSDDPQWHGADSLELLATCAEQVRGLEFEIVNIDLTIIVQSVRIASSRTQMRENLASALQIDMSRVSVKATTTDGLGWIGSDEGLAAHATASLRR